MTSTIAAYVYPGWHHCPERDRHFAAGFSEWDLVYEAGPRFEGHRQPHVPLLGRYDDSLPRTADAQIGLAQQHGVNLFIYPVFWSRGKRVFEAALDQGFLGSSGGKTFPFGLMWANRMPRRVLPVKRDTGPLIHPARLVHTDPEDFLSFIQFIAREYFERSNYFRLGGVPYLSIFDTSFFLRQLGVPLATEAIAAAKTWLLENGHGGLHVAAIDPAEEFRGQLKNIGFDSVTHYVLLPQWKGPLQQDFLECAHKRAEEWSVYKEQTGLAYFPSISPGWDATPRAADFGRPKERRYPWSPVVTGSGPERFAGIVEKALRYVQQSEADPLLFIASWNEWSEGHYLEPDERFGYGWLEAVKHATEK